MTIIFQNHISEAKIEIMYERGDFTSSDSFANLVGKLTKLSGYQEPDEKSSFTVNGYFDKEAFILVDFKNDECVHIYSYNPFNVIKFNKELTELLKNVHHYEPHAYEWYDALR